MFPPHTGICLDCRVTLTAGESCTWLSHRLCDLAGDCEPLIAQVWGPVREVERAGLLADFPGFVGDALTRRGRVRTHERDRPLGAATEPMVPVNATGFRGRIAEAPTFATPLGKARGIGFALEVRHHEAAGSPIMLRDGACADFTVMGDDGRTFMVRPGSLRMALDRRARTERRFERVVPYLRALAPEAGAPSPFPWDEVRVAVLVPGDVVTVRAMASISPDPRATTAYRDAPRSILVARGAVWIERHG